MNLLNVCYINIFFLFRVRLRIGNMEINPQIQLVRTENHIILTDLITWVITWFWASLILYFLLYALFYFNHTTSHYFSLVSYFARFFQVVYCFPFFLIDEFIRRWITSSPLPVELTCSVRIKTH